MDDHRSCKDTHVDRDDALAISAFVKAQAAYNNLRNLQRLISAFYKNCDADQKKNCGLWLSPPAYSRQAITLTPEERAVFLRHGKPDLFEFVSDLDHVHNSTVEAVNRFTEFKIDFMQSVPAIKSAAGMIPELTPENRPTIEPKVVLLDNIARQLPGRIDEDTAYVQRAVLALLDHIKGRGVQGANFKFTDRTAATTSGGPASC